MTTDSILKWHDRQKARDDESRELSESLLGPEKAIFDEAMWMLSTFVSAALRTFEAGDRIRDTDIRLKFALIHYGFNLLWAAWSEALAGRYHAATDHLRSIRECPEFLIALSLNPQLANDWESIDIHTARRTIKRHLDDIRKGAGAEILKETQDVAKQMQRFSHITLESLGQILPAIERGGRTLLVVRLGGQVSGITLRMVSIHLTRLALFLLGPTIFALSAIAYIDDELRRAFLDRADRHRAILEKEQAALSADAAALTPRVYFAQGDEPI